MIRKMRIKLVIAAMLSLLVVLVAIIGAAGALNYRNIVSDADQKLQILSENGGRFPEELVKDTGAKSGAGTAVAEGTGIGAESGTNAKSSAGAESRAGAETDVGDKERRFSPEMPFEARYFSAVILDDGSVQSVDTGRIASVNAEQAAEYAKAVLQEGETSGFTDMYRFLVCADSGEVGGENSQNSGSVENNGTAAKRIYFLSCHREFETFHRFLLNSIVVAVVGAVAVLILLIVTSQRIVQPVSEAYEKQKRFITDAGHELKTPLTIISADAEVLEMDYGENEWLQDIRSQTARLADLTEQLVYLARMEENPEVEHTEFSLSDVVSEAAEDFQAVARTKGKDLQSVVEPGLCMNGDEMKIRRLIAIFLDNAMKYTDEQGSVRLSLDKWRGQLRLQVYNTTGHMERASLEHLFDRFYRTDASRNSKTGGYGLGLSIAAAITQAHRGKIAATTEDEKSLLITVLFPEA